MKIEHRIAYELMLKASRQEGLTAFLDKYFRALVLHVNNQESSSFICTFFSCMIKHLETITAPESNEINNNPAETIKHLRKSIKSNIRASYPNSRISISSNKDKQINYVQEPHTGKVLYFLDRELDPKDLGPKIKVKKILRLIDDKEIKDFFCKILNHDTTDIKHYIQRYLGYNIDDCEKPEMDEKFEIKPYDSKSFQDRYRELQSAFDNFVKTYKKSLIINVIHQKVSYVLKYDIHDARAQYKKDAHTMSENSRHIQNLEEKIEKIILECENKLDSDIENDPIIKNLIESLTKLIKNLEFIKENEIKIFAKLQKLFSLDSISILQIEKLQNWLKEFYRSKSYEKIYICCLNFPINNIPEEIKDFIEIYKKLQEADTVDLKIELVEDIKTAKSNLFQFFSSEVMNELITEEEHESNQEIKATLELLIENYIENLNSRISFLAQSQRYQASNLSNEIYSLLKEVGETLYGEVSSNSQFEMEENPIEKAMEIIDPLELLPMYNELQSFDNIHKFLDHVLRSKGFKQYSLAKAIFNLYEDINGHKVDFSNFITGSIIKDKKAPIIKLNTESEIDLVNLRQTSFDTNKISHKEFNIFMKALCAKESKSKGSHTKFKVNFPSGFTHTFTISSIYSTDAAFYINHIKFDLYESTSQGMMEQEDFEFLIEAFARVNVNLVNNSTKNNK